MATQPLQIPISVDLKRALAGFKKLQQGAARTFGKISRSANTLANVVTGFSSAVDLAKGALDGLDRSMQAVVKTGQQIERGRFFGVTIQDARDLQKEFDGAITKANAFNTLIELQASGIGKQLAPEIAKVTRALSFVSGLPRSQVLEQLTSGEVADDLLQKVGVRAGELALATQQRANALDRELTKYDRVQVALGLIRKGAARLGTTLDKIAAKDLVNPITKLRTALSDIVFGVLRTIAPEINKIVKSAGGVDKIVKRIETFVKSTLIPAIQSLVKQTKKALKKIADEAKTSGRSFFSVFKDRMAEAIADGIVIGIGKASKKGAKALGKLAISAFTSSQLASADFQRKQAAELRARNRQFAALNAPIPALSPQEAQRIAALNLQPLGPLKTGGTKTGGTKTGGTRGGRRGVSRAAQEIAAERAALASEARTLTRNFLSSALDALSNLGGTISGVFASLKDLPEKARVFLATRKTREALLSVVKDVEKPLLQQLQLIRQNTKLTDQQKQAATIFAIQSKAGLNDAKEFLRNQEVVSKELQAQGSFLESNAQLAAVAKLENDKITDVLTAQADLLKQEQVLLLERARLQKQVASSSGVRLTRSKVLLSIVEQQLARTRRFGVVYGRNNELQQLSIRLQKELAKLEAEQEAARQAALSRKIAQDAKLRTQELQAQLVAARGFSAEATLLQQQIAGKKQIAEIDAQILATNQAIQKTAVQAANDALKGNLAASKAAQTRVAALTQQKKALEDQRSLQQTISRQLEENAARATTFAGGLRSAFADAESAARNFSNALGQQLGSLARSAIQFATDSLVKLGEGLGSLAQGLQGFDIGADFRKRALSFLSDLAIQLGSFFITAGTGLLLTGDVARGPALIGIGAALATGGGFAKAFAGGSAGSAASTAGINAIRSTPSAVPARRQEQVTQETYILFNRTPWSLGTPEQEFREFKSWQERQRRTIGGR